ncbi:MAG TPA: WXG100 family type VII secretion target [Candidatus Limnocylindrales bacterium]
MSRIAAEIPQLFALKNSLDRQAGTIDGLRTELRNQLSNTVWEGRSADRFRAEWADYERVLMRMSAALTDAALEVQSRANRLTDADA